MTAMQVALVVSMFVAPILGAAPAPVQNGQASAIGGLAGQHAMTAGDFGLARPPLGDPYAVPAAMAPTATQSAQAAPRVLPVTGGSDPLAYLGGFDGLWVLLALGIAFLLLGSLSYLPHPPNPPKRSQRR